MGCKDESGNALPDERKTRAKASDVAELPWSGGIAASDHARNSGIPG
jgi:hypothetical protein